MKVNIFNFGEDSFYRFQCIFKSIHRIQYPNFNEISMNKFSIILNFTICIWLESDIIENFYKIFHRITFRFCFIAVFEVKLRSLKFSTF